MTDPMAPPTIPPPTPIAAMPRPAIVATYGALIVGTYAAAMAGASMLVGAFVGLQGFLAAGIYALAATPLILAGRGLIARAAWGRWLAIATSALGLLAIAAALAIGRPTDRAPWIIAATSALILAAIGSAAAMPATVRWCRRG